LLLPLLVLLALWMLLVLVRWRQQQHHPGRQPRDRPLVHQWHDQRYEAIASQQRRHSNPQPTKYRRDNGGVSSLQWGVSLPSWAELLPDKPPSLHLASLVMRQP